MTRENIMPVCPECQHTTHEAFGCTGNDYECGCERMWTHDEYDQIANACECEHESHFTTTNPSHAHAFLGVPSVATVQTHWGTFRMCQSCADDMPAQYLTVPKCPNCGTSETYLRGLTTLCASCGDVLVSPR